jgi:hypothetical protein
MCIVAQECHQEDPQTPGTMGRETQVPPRRAKTHPLHTEPHIDYSDSQVPPSDNGFYVDLSPCDAQAGPGYPADLSV